MVTKQLSARKANQIVAYHEGYNAWHCNATEADNRYAGTEKGQYWLNGWRKAAEDADIAAVKVLSASLRH